MSEMVGRVARAIFKAENGCEAVPDYWKISPRASRYIERARAAIEAMRDPTEAMISARDEDSESEDAQGEWRAMIDEALR